jgi:hypothetical protein
MSLPKGATIRSRPSGFLCEVADMRLWSHRLILRRETMMFSLTVRMRILSGLVTDL